MEKVKIYLLNGEELETEVRDYIDIEDFLKEQGYSTEDVRGIDKIVKGK